LITDYYIVCFLIEIHYDSRDKAREKIRQEKLAIYRETGVWPSSKANSGPMKKNESWSEKKAQKSRKKEKKKLRVEQKKRKRAAVDEDEWNELARDARLLKKLKKRKVQLTCRLNPF
jgi:ATP-dependent RNA helicase DDX55/SPB4